MDSEARSCLLCMDLVSEPVSGKRSSCAPAAGWRLCVSWNPSRHASAPTEELNWAPRLEPRLLPSHQEQRALCSAVRAPRAAGRGAELTSGAELRLCWLCERWAGERQGGDAWDSPANYNICQTFKKKKTTPLSTLGSYSECRSEGQDPRRQLQRCN